MTPGIKYTFPYADRGTAPFVVTLDCPKHHEVEVPADVETGASFSCGCGWSITLRARDVDPPPRTALEARMAHLRFDQEPEA
jgi:hypothetical protein